MKKYLLALINFIAIGFVLISGFTMAFWRAGTLPIAIIFLIIGLLFLLNVFLILFGKKKYFIFATIINIFVFVLYVLLDGSKILALPSATRLVVVLPIFVIQVGNLLLESSSIKEVCLKLFNKN